ncbi:MAG TPA: Type 1 glutamine amidotransferase-like domain-containing protein [Patescibacteria group bacterium]|nr:Type 1 glutamine amidotransferase-like domain-containing protein [Patescibacteria group bacterium]
MKQLFLTSSVHAVAHDIAKRVDLSKNNKLVFITTPAEPKAERGDLQWLRNDRQALVDAGFDVSDYTITGKSQDQLETDLARFDFIYMSGGDTYYLLEKSQKSGFISVVNNFVRSRGKIYIGTSAGSIITGEKCPDYLDMNSASGLENTDGYGLVNFTILPHWGSDDFRKKYLGNRLEIAYRKNQVPLLLLTDTQYVHVQDECMSIIDVR